METRKIEKMQGKALNEKIIEKTMIDYVLQEI